MPMLAENREPIVFHVLPRRILLRQVIGLIPVLDLKKTENAWRVAYPELWAICSIERIWFFNMSLAFSRRTFRISS